MDITARTITEYMDSLEIAKANAEVHLAALGEACRRAIVDLSGALEALANGHQATPHAQDAAPTPAPLPADTTVHRMSREESKRRNDGIDKAVLSVLTEDAGADVRVAFIAKRIVLDGMNVTEREVSQSLQRLVKLGAAVRPGSKKGYWTAVAMTQPAENGMHAEHHAAEESTPEDTAAALEEAGVVRGDEWPSPDEYTRL